MINDEFDHSFPLDFPADFTIKVIGKAKDSFEQAALGIITKHFHELKENAIEQKTSEDNNYLSLSITVPAENKEQLDNVYQELNKCPDVIMTL